MASERNNDSRPTYTIPENFIEGGRVLNGSFRLRNAIEAVVLGGLFGFIAYCLPISTLPTRISVILMVALPPTLLALIGINGDPLSVFVRSAYRWKKNHRIMIYNKNTAKYSVSALEVMMSEELPKDKVIAAYENWKNKRAKKEAEYRRNTSYVFEDDDELLKVQKATQKSNSSTTSECSKINNPPEHNPKNEFVFTGQDAGNEEPILDFDINEEDVQFDENDILN